MLPGYQQQTHHNLILPLNFMHPNLIFYGAASFSLEGCTGAARTAKLRHPFKSTQIEVAQLWGTAPPALSPLRKLSLRRSAPHAWRRLKGSPLCLENDLPGVSLILIRQVILSD
jgi:hypothetical protein